MTKRKSNKKFLLGLTVACLLPLSFYFIAKGLSRDKIHLPGYYVADRVDSSLVDGKMVKDSIFHQVADLRLTNQLGSLVSLNEDLKGRIVLVNFFFSTCPTVCPKLTAHMGMIQKVFRRNPKMDRSLENSVHFLSLTVDPERDSFPALRAYAERYNADHDHWWFLTGDRKDIYNFARKELRVVMEEGNGGADDFIHSQTMVLLDQDRYIRGYYNGLDTMEIRRCADDIVLLTLEKKRKHKK
jgi:protein SCO1/2